MKRGGTFGLRVLSMHETGGGSHFRDISEIFSPIFRTSSKTATDIFVQGCILFETFLEEEYLEEVFQTPPIPVQMKQKSFHSGIKVQSSSKYITTIPAILALPVPPILKEMLYFKYYSASSKNYQKECSLILLKIKVGFKYYCDIKTGW